MGIASRIQESFYRLTGRTELAEAVHAERQMVDQLKESMAGLEASMREPGWQRMVALADQEFTREGLRIITATCRVMGLKNSLIKRGISLRTAYIWGQGVQISARDAAKKGSGQDVNALIQEFMDDPGNRRVFSGQQAREELERSLSTDGNVFLALFTAPRTGQVQIRSIPWDEIADIICNPQDNSEPWYYKRVWTERSVDPITGGYNIQQRTAYYPALGYRPNLKPKRIRNPQTGDEIAEVFWDAPVCHIKVGGLRGWKYGVPDVYAAIDWANAYREFLTDWAGLVKALSRFAWRLTSKGSRQASARAKLAAQPSHDRVSGEPNYAGATASLPPDMALEAIPKSGATIDSDSGRPVAAMVAAAMDIPVTMLLGDPGVTGARATAETLDPPTEWMAQSRRAVWTEKTNDILAYVIAESVRAPEGALRGTITRDPSGRETVTLRGKSQGTIDITWPDVAQVSVTTLIQAIVQADGTTYLPPLLIARLLMEALGVTDIDEILDQLSDEQGNFLRPDGGGGGAGQAAVDAFRRGEDPAAAYSDPGTAPPAEQPADPVPQPAAA